MRSQFFGNRILSIRNADPFFTRHFMCPPPEISQDELDKFKALETGSKATAAELAQAKAELEKLKGTGNPNPKPDDDDLQKKAAKEREEKDKRNSDSKRLEAALKFSMGSADWLKNNSTLLPKNIEGIFTAAEKEKYENAIEKDSAIKAGIIKEFFGVQANVDALTTGPKSALEDFLKLTKNKQEETAQHIWETVFEPAFATLKAVTKAQQLNNGHKNQSDGEKALAERMMKMSKKHYLGEKENGT